MDSGRAVIEPNEELRRKIRVAEVIWYNQE
jgi:hypothetical protein